MSRLVDELRGVGIYNSHGFFAEKGQVWLSYVPQVGPFGARWQVHRQGYLTDPESHWSDNQHKTFPTFGRRRDGMTDRAAALENAKEWAGARYGIEEWKRDPFGSYGDARFVAERLRKLKEQSASRSVSDGGAGRQVAS